MTDETPRPKTKKGQPPLPTLCPKCGDLIPVIVRTVHGAKVWTQRPVCVKCKP